MNASPFDQLLHSKPSSESGNTNRHKEKLKRLKVIQSSDSDEGPYEVMKNEDSDEKTEIVKKTPKPQKTFDLNSDLDEDGDTGNAKLVSSISQSQGRAIIDSDSENDGSGSGTTQNIQRNRPLLIDSDSDSDVESPHVSTLTKVQPVKSSPLKESSILNSSLKKYTISSDEELDSVENVSHKPKSTKHFLSSSEDSGGELNSPKKARIQGMSKLRM